MIIRLFDYLRRHRGLWISTLCILTALLVSSLLRLSYKEDISDFLPLSDEERTDMDIYQDISGVNDLYILFQGDKDNPDETVSAIDCFYAETKKLDHDGWTSDMTIKFNMDRIQQVTDFVYNNIPIFLTDRDYQRMDSLLALPGYVNSQLEQDQQMLMFPSGGLLSENIARDPLNLFTPTVAKLQDQERENKFEMYADGYVFTPDMTRAIVLLSSPFGNAETSQNTILMNLLDTAIQKMHQRFPHVSAHVIGGPQIAVGNASQIKHDSILAVSLSVVLILLLLFISIRSRRNILLIALSIAWGWLFALGLIAVFHDSISIIVIGISSVIVGIAVNYPLHLIAHTSHESSLRQCLKDIAGPLLVGNITTVGAFVALMPLDSVALRDLGLFASLLLIGTIFFVLVFLPQMVKSKEGKELKTQNSKLKTRKLLQKGNRLLERIAEVQLDNKKWLLAVVAILTVVFGWFSLQVEFDSNLSHINYMTTQQHEDMAYFENLLTPQTSTPNTQHPALKTQNSKLKTQNSKPNTTIYIVSSANTIDAALDSCLQKNVPGSVSQFLTSRKEQTQRIARWKEFVEAHHGQFTGMMQSAVKVGFSSDAFSDFYAIINGSYQPHPFSYFQPLTSTVFAGNLSIHKDGGHLSPYAVIDKLQVKEEDVEKTEKKYPGSFDIESLNSSLANSLSDNFNYIGWSCSMIVFFFLWFSFRSFKLAVISFVPMAVSWLWILGLMAMLGIKFNIVNIILATFIFGQGDDYTIFITEGCVYEDKYKKPILASYKHSILLSAIIMFVGIGTLIIARHPVLHSLAEITIIGMASVVFMSWLLPPFLYRISKKLKIK